MDGLHVEGKKVKIANGLIPTCTVHVYIYFYISSYICYRYSHNLIGLFDLHVHSTLNYHLSYRKYLHTQGNFGK